MWSLATVAPGTGLAQSSKLVVQTVPSIEGIRFRVGGQTFITDEHGVAEIAPTTAGARTLEVDEHLLIDKSQRVEFAAWSDGILDPSRALDLEDSSGLQVGFNIDYLVKERFHSPSGELIDPSSIDSYTIVDDANNSTTFDGSSTGLAGPTALVWQRFPPGTRWLRAVRLVRTDGALETERVSYTVRSVTFDGRRVAGSSEPFFPTGGSEWPITTEASAFPMGGLSVAAAALLLLLAGFFVLMRLRADDRTAVAHDPAPSRPLIRGRTARRQTQARIYVRVKLRNGRTVEGWKMTVPGVTDSEAIYINATQVWGSDGEQVTPGPLDSFVLPSQIIDLEMREDLPQVLS
jgi:hypothetical protein